MNNTLLSPTVYKHSGTFANRKYEELSYPQNQKMCASNSIENATPL